MAIYLKTPDVKGSVSTQGFEGWVDLRSFQFSGISQQVQQRSGNMAERLGGGLSFGYIYLQKTPDQTTPYWFSCAHSSKVIPNIEIDFVMAGTPPFAYQKINLTNVVISHFSQEYAAGDALATELLTLAFDTIQMGYVPRTADNQMGSPVIAGYNIAQAQKL